MRWVDRKKKHLPRGADCSPSFTVSQNTQGKLDFLRLPQDFKRRTGNESKVSSESRIYTLSRARSWYDPSDYPRDKYFPLHHCPCSQPFTNSLLLADDFSDGMQCSLKELWNFLSQATNTSKNLILRQSANTAYS